MKTIEYDFELDGLWVIIKGWAEVTYAYHPTADGRWEDAEVEINAVVVREYRLIGRNSRIIDRQEIGEAELRGIRFGAELLYQQREEINDACLGHARDETTRQ